MYIFINTCLVHSGYTELKVLLQIEKPKKELKQRFYDCGYDGHSLELQFYVKKNTEDNFQKWYNEFM